MPETSESKEEDTAESEKTGSRSDLNIVSVKISYPFRSKKTTDTLERPAPPISAGETKIRAW